MSTPASSSQAAFPPPALQSLLTEITSHLISTTTTLSIAETAAGGLISSSLLSTPGASKFYKGGLTLYTLPSRICYAGWTEEEIKAYRGPTPQICADIAGHVRKDLESTYTLCESGTAGPTGGSTPNRRPGYVALAVVCERGTYVREIAAPEEGKGEDRAGNMVMFAVEGLRLLRDVMMEKEGVEKL